MDKPNMDNSQRTKPWEDENGATNVDGFLKAFAEDSNTFWRMESGHALNIIEELIERHSLALQALRFEEGYCEFHDKDSKHHNATLCLYTAYKQALQSIEVLREALLSAKKTLEVAVKDTPLLIGQVTIMQEIGAIEKALEATSKESQ